MAEHQRDEGAWRSHGTALPDAEVVHFITLYSGRGRPLVVPLLDQINNPASTVLVDGLYYSYPTCRTVLDHHPDATFVIPPGSTAVLSDTAEAKPT
jgi:hypothetical protein